VLSGGEALMHAQIWRITAALKLRRIRVTILSSGLLLASKAAELVQHVDEVIVSLDGPPEVHDSIRRVAGAFELLREGVDQLRRLDAQFPVGARCTVQRNNFSYLRRTTEAAEAIRLDSISFLAADLSSTAFNRPEGWPLERRRGVELSESDVVALEGEVEDLIEEGKCGGFVLESAEKLRRIPLHFRAHLGLSEPVAPRCNAPWNSAVVEANGDVLPCFFQPPIGNLRSGRMLVDVLNGTSAQAFRESLDVKSNPICKRCVCARHWEAD
jgi:radical SAM protein with 4Fe4S-binding SPASM domain